MIGFVKRLFHCNYKYLSRYVFYRSHKFTCRSLLLSTTVLNDTILKVIVVCSNRVVVSGIGDVIIVSLFMTHRSIAVYSTP